MASRWKFWQRWGRKYDSLELFKEIFGGWANWTGKEVNLQTVMQVAAAMACGRLLGDQVAMMPWKVFRRTGKSIEPETSHPLYDKLATRPNPLQSAFEFQEQIGLHLAFCGNAFIWTPTVRGQIDALYPLEPAWVTVKYSWPERPRYEVRVGDGRGPFTLSADELWHIRGPSWSGYVGLEFMQYARQALGLAMAIEEGQAKLQSEGVKSPGYLQAEGTLTDDQEKKLRAWLAKHNEGKNAGGPLILDKKLAWVTTAMTNTDAQVVELRKFAVEEVCRFMRVLPIMVGHADKTATYASAEQMILAHLVYTMGPWARRLEASADVRLLTPEERKAGLYTNLNEKALLRMAARDQGEYLARLILTGVMTRNEAREKLDMNPLAGLDEPLAPANTFVGNPPKPDDAKPPRAADDPE